MQNLPILEKREEIISVLAGNRPLILKAPTGTGKSTQLPQIALDCNLFSGTILVLEPRRLAARMLASRVAQERGEAVGATVGYQTRFETEISENTRIRFITEGILPRMLLSDSTLSSISMVVFDEFHERSLTTDLGLALVSRLRRERPDLRIVVMSATLEAGQIETFLKGSRTIELQDALYPVDVRYYPKSQTEPVWESALSAINGLATEGHAGDILVFMPGAYEIRKTSEALRRARFREAVTILPLYGDLPVPLQNRVMEPCEQRKIIIATNIAETSLTIPGVRHVIDSGLARINRYDPTRGFNTLYIEPISRASAQQRLGRAGREGAGVCVRLWGRASEEGRAQCTPPEVTRVDLAETVLYLRMLGFDDPVRFHWFESPGREALRNADDVLNELGLTLVSQESGCAKIEVTAEGALLASLPMHPRLARLLVESARQGAPREGALAAALLSERPVTSGRLSLRDRVDTDNMISDFTALGEVIRKAAELSFDVPACSTLGINASAARQVIRMQAYYVQQLRRLHLAARDSATDRDESLAKAVLLAYPDRLARRRDKGTLLCDMRGGRRGELSKESCVRKYDLLVAAEIRETRQQPGTPPRTTLSLATGVNRAWLQEMFPDRWTTGSEIVWNTQRLAVESKQKTWCLGVLIEEKDGPEPDTGAASNMLADKIIERNLALDKWDSSVKEWLDRAAWVAQAFPESGVPLFSESDRKLVIHEMCRNENRYSVVKKKPVLPLVLEILSYEQRHLVDSLAPQVISLTGEKRLRVSYEPQQPPRARAKIQDLYDLKSSPRVGNGSVVVLLEILAPNMRQVQVTDDLEGFWRVHYPELKKTLSRRYPKHQWR